MSREPTSRERFDAMVRERGVERLVLFSDAVFAIAMTLLVLDLRVPIIPPDLSTEVTSRLLAHRLAALGPAYFGYLLSFVVIAIYWRAHHRKFLAIDRLDGGLVVLNLAFLLSISFLPFPTAVLGRYGNTTVAVVLYAASMAVAGVLSGAITFWSVRRGLLSEEVDPSYASLNGMWRPLILAAVFALSIPLAFASPEWAECSWVLMLPITVLVVALYRRGERRRTPSTAANLDIGP